MESMEQEIWKLHDARLSDHERKFADEARVGQEIKDTLKQLMERVNEGISKTQQKILDKDSQIEISMRDLTHAVEIQNIKLNDKIDTVHSQIRDRIEPLEQSNRARDKVYVWGVLAGLILGIVGFFTTKFLEKMSPKDTTSTEQVSNLKARPLRN
jgi:hypothetical protein